MTIQKRTINRAWKLVMDYLIDPSVSLDEKSRIARYVFQPNKSLKELNIAIIRKGKKHLLCLDIEQDDSRKQREAREWRNSVLSRDKNKCQKCGKTKNLEGHHIKSWKEYPHLRFDVDNGITLCKKCHCKTDNYGSKNNGI